MNENHEWLACLHNKSNGHIVVYDLNDAYRLISRKTYFNKRQIVIVNQTHVHGHVLLERLTQLDTRKNNAIIIATNETESSADMLCKQYGTHAYISLKNANKELKILFGNEFEL